MFDEIRAKAFGTEVNIEDYIDRIEIAYDNIIKLAKITRTEGILALEFHSGFVKDSKVLADDLYWMVQLVVCGNDPKVIENFVTLRFYVNNFKGIDAFIYYLYSQGILYVQDGCTPCFIEDFFNAAIPENCNIRRELGGKHFNRERLIFDEENRQKLHEFRNLLSEEDIELVQNVENLMNGMNSNEWWDMTHEDGVAGWEWIVPAVKENCRYLIDAHMHMGKILSYLWYVSIPKGDEVKEACEDFVAKLDFFRNKGNEKKAKFYIETEFLRQLSEEEDHIIIEVLNSVRNETLALALKGCDVLERRELLSVMEKKHRYQVEDAIDSMGPVRMMEIRRAIAALKLEYLKIKEMEKNNLLLDGL